MCNFWWGMMRLQALGARAVMPCALGPDPRMWVCKPACLGLQTYSLGSAESGAGCRPARLSLFRPAPGVCRPP